MITFSLIICWTTMPFCVNVWDTRFKQWPFLSINTVRYLDLPQMVNRIPSCILSWHICVIGSQCWFSVRLFINNAAEKLMLHCKGVSLFDVASQYMSGCNRNWWPGGTAKIYPTKKSYSVLAWECVIICVCVCIFFLWLRLGVNGPEHNRNDRFKELLRLHVMHELSGIRYHELCNKNLYPVIKQCWMISGREV